MQRLQSSARVESLSEEASTGTSRFAIYAELALKEAYSTSVTAMRDNVMKSFKKRN